MCLLVVQRLRSTGDLGNCRDRVVQGSSIDVGVGWNPEAALELSDHV